jgi:hypothetical protein
VSWGADRPVGDILVAGTRNSARGAVPAQVRVQKQLRPSSRVIGRPTSRAQPRLGLERLQIHLIDSTQTVQTRCSAGTQFTNDGVFNSA